MGRLQLRYDRQRLAFLALVSIELTPGRWTAVELLVDSGSNTSGVTAPVASANGVALSRLPWGDLSVVGGLSTQPFLAEARAALHGDPGAGVRLRPLWVLAESQYPLDEADEGGILGLDALDAYGARLILDLRAGRGFIEW